MHKTIKESEKKRAIRIAKILCKMYPQARVFLNHSNPFELLVAVILSAQCTDKKVNEVTNYLFKKYKTLHSYAIADPRQFERDIFATGFYKTKTKHILATAKIIEMKFGGSVPKTMESLTSLPGVGRKTANIILESAFDIIEGIPVDTHVFRLAHVLGLSRGKTPEQVEKDLCAIFPRKYWNNLSYRLISYGREHCTARRHNHTSCPLSKIEV